MRGVAVETQSSTDSPSRCSAPLRGEFQVANVATAVAVCDALRADRHRHRRRRSRSAGARTCAGRGGWTGSRATPPILIDGAHNPAGMAAMVASARELIGRRHCVAVFAAMRNKDVASMAAGSASSPATIVVTAPAVERATPPADLADLFDPPPTIAADVASALDRARSRAGRDGVVVVCGSLYLAGEVLGLLGALNAIRRRERRGAWPRASASAGSRRCAPRPCRRGRSSASGCS